MNMTFDTGRTERKAFAHWQSCAWALGLLLVLLMPGKSWAQNCVGNSFGIDFGTVSSASSTDGAGTLGYQCQGNGNLPRTYFKVCFLMSGGSSPTGTEGVNPRRMSNYNGSFINYNLYSNAARTNLIGPPPTGGGYPAFTWELETTDWSNPTREMSIYGRVSAIPAGTPAGGYQVQGGNLVLQYAWSNTAMPFDCFQTTGGGGARAVPVGYSGSRANVSNSCTIALSRPQDLDFGSHGSIPTPINSSTAISLSCPSNLNWKIGLSNGVNASGTQRRMKNPGGNFINYELYRNSARTQRWGNDITGGTDTASGSGSTQVNPTVLTVYGRVPAQASVAPGSYVDTVTVTLTY